ncbi:tRNA 2-thiouridine(34) synthase MnmA, partial [bacterium]|nr:tRNA 2-thiouridine(34) synthase MnmA [bacterium]
LARHGGIANFTIGQRKGLGFSSAQPMYVSRIDPETNRVFVDYDENCVSSRAFATDVNWISIVEPLQAIDCEVKVRYRSDPQRATLNPSNDGVVISFAEPVRAITPGQSAVFYSGETVLGGGILQVFSEEARHE